MNKTLKITNYVVIVVVIGLIIALFNSYTRINELNNSVSNLQNNLDQNINTMRTDIADIYENVDQRLKKEASILSGYDITYGPLDTTNYTTPILVSVTPKNADNNTSVSVNIGETTVQLNRKGEVFSGYIDTNVFIADSTLPLITVKNSSSTQNEYLEDHDMKNLFTVFMPYLYSDLVIREEAYSNNKTKVSYELSVDSKPQSENSTTTYTQIWLVGESNGKEVFRNDITQKVENSNGKIILIEKTFNSAEYKNYSDMKYFIVATDSLGFTHKCPINTLNHSSDGSTTELEQATDGWGCIYDKDGKLLYGKE
ncbi:MAG: hypothetical protein UHM16_07940 [Acutalibacteraceae bacterium]|nr:hypothetical protein [Acutalibacteraceae bacterium]